jgi:hypothetical protein
MRQLGPDTRRFKHEIEAMKRERRKRKLEQKAIKRLLKKQSASSGRTPMEMK